eukprot:324403-Chlamydomonas_euryale.AAC.2
MAMLCAVAVDGAGCDATDNAFPEAGTWTSAAAAAAAAAVAAHAATATCAVNARAWTAPARRRVLRRLCHRATHNLFSSWRPSGRICCGRPHAAALRQQLEGWLWSGAAEPRVLDCCSARLGEEAAAAAEEAAAGVGPGQGWHSGMRCALCALNESRRTRQREGHRPPRHGRANQRRQLRRSACSSSSSSLRRGRRLAVHV